LELDLPPDLGGDGRGRPAELSLGIDEVGE
jgi:hypothetical protein